MSKPVVSIVMPVYNAENVLEGTLASLKQQTLSDFELICVNDGSSDESGAILDKANRDDPRVIHAPKQNGGAASARNIGIELATGDFIIFLDADDLFDPMMLQLMSNAIIEGDADVCVCETDSFRDGDGHKSPSHRIPSGIAEGTYDRGQVEGSLFEIGGGWAVNKMYRRKLVMESGLRFQDLPCANDEFFSQAMIAEAERIAVLKRSLYLYRIDAGGSIADRKFRNPLCYALAGEKLFDEISNRNKLSEIGMKSLVNECWRMTMHSVMVASYAQEQIEEALCFAKRCAAKWGPYSWSLRDPKSAMLAYKYWSYMHANAKTLAWAYRNQDKSRGKRFPKANKIKMGARLSIAVLRAKIVR